MCEYSKCQRCSKEGTNNLHSCPYDEDINGDYEDKCNCCEDCQHECAMDI